MNFVICAINVTRVNLTLVHQVKVYTWRKPLCLGVLAAGSLLALTSYFVIKYLLVSFPKHIRHRISPKTSNSRRILSPWNEVQRVASFLETGTLSVASILAIYISYSTVWTDQPKFIPFYSFYIEYAHVNFNNYVFNGIGVIGFVLIL